MVYAIVAAIILIADQWLKYWVTVSIVLDTGEVALIPGIIKLVNIHNEGAAFGMMDSGNMRWVFVALAVAFSVLLVVLLAKRVLSGKFAHWCSALAIAGAIGNAIDRVMYGYVVDMFKPEFIDFYIFNFADVVLVLSCLMFIVYIFVGGEEPAKQPEKSQKSEKQPMKESRTEKPKTAAKKPEKREAMYSNPKIGVSSVSSASASGKRRSIVDDDGVRVAEPENAVDEAWNAEDKSAQPDATSHAAAPDESEFDLESILAEFRDV